MTWLAAWTMLRKFLSSVPTQVWVAVAVAILIGGVYVKGRVDGGQAEASDSATRIAKAEARAARAATDLRTAAAALRAAANRFTEIDRQTRANARLAAQQRLLGEAQAAAAGAEAARLQRSVHALEARLRAERATCTDGSRPICGTPLR